MKTALPAGFWRITAKMNISKSNIDAGKAFDWGKASADYAKYCDIYPQEFYEKIISRKLCTKGQKCLDLGTGTGVLPRNLYGYGAQWTGTDISENQVAFAKALSEKEGMNIDYYAVSAEDIDYPDDSFDVITACQCFFYFDHEKVLPNLARMLKPNGRLLILYMAWLPFEDKIAGESEKLVLKYNPKWSGAGETMHPIVLPVCASETFEVTHEEVFRLNVPFTRESWHGRMRACRGVGASLNAQELAMWDKEHRCLLEKTTPEQFEIAHYAALMELRPKK